MKNKTKNIFGFHRNVFFLGVVSFLNDMSSEMIYPLLPVFLNSTLHASYSFIGLIESAAESAASFLKLASGILSDKIRSRKGLTFAGYALSATLRPLVGIATSPLHVLFIRFSDRVGKGIRTSPRDALIADVVEPHERGKAFGFHRAMDHTGAVAGPVLAWLILLFITKSYRVLFLLALIPGLLSLPFLAFFVREEKKSNSQDPKPRTQEQKISLAAFDKKFKTFLAVMFIFTLSNSSDAFLLLKLKKSGLPVTFIPLAWVAFHIVKMFSSVPFSSLSDRIGRKKVILSGWLLYSLVYFAFAVTSCLYGALAIFLVYGLFYGLTEGVERAFVSDLVDENMRASAFGTFHFAVGMGMLPASFMFGFLWDNISSAAAFAFGGTFSLLAALLMLLFV